MGEALEGARGIVLATKVPIAAAARRARVAGGEPASGLRRSQVDLLQIHGNSIDGEPLPRASCATGGMLDQLRRGCARRDWSPRSGSPRRTTTAASTTLIETGAFDTMQIAYNLAAAAPVRADAPVRQRCSRRRSTGCSRSRCAPSPRASSRNGSGWPIRPNDFDYTPALIQFVLSNPLIDVALVGMRTPAEVDANVAIWRDEGGPHRRHRALDALRRSG